MKKILFLLFIMCIMLLPVMCWAVAGSVTTTGPTQLSSHVYKYVYSWVGDSTNGTVPATAGPAINGWVFMIVTDPGSTPPTTQYDITLTDSDAADIAGGTLANRSATASEQVVPLLVSTAHYGPRYVKGTLTLNITNQTDVSATGTVTVYVKTDDPIHIP